ncbi:Pantothenate synthetase [Limihaloglobus sulfuriphilus]|uniref:Pantothenate synthetase n=1 Tax=Limihaloglobus sulfuriphilus TaxID=1851148 RepID=A0A1Q2MCH6_9BACT|nr:pantoate--beta-alanine ligase [Limihaloglobus sulfuriphilus]AQQ70395.1 Pantothenate synthetase [Limihaloglobus sulfuriphilus]
MDIAEKIEEIKVLTRKARTSGKSIGFVPTMGALHAGHVSLIEAACSRTDYVVVSIFVNPVQFSPGEDLENYPRTLEDDRAKCQSAGADLIFVPSVKEMYPDKLQSWVEVEGQLTENLCGKSRPGHFRGVTTVCAKLFNIVMPDIAFFGRKDAQQAAVLKKMVKDLNMPLQLQVCPIIREKSGLAMSSRNKYLSDKERQDAAVLYQSLVKCREMVDSGTRNARLLVDTMRKMISNVDGAEIDYIQIVDPDTLEDVDTVEKQAMAALAVKIGPARLIDNIMLNVSAAG